MANELKTWNWLKKNYGDEVPGKDRDAFFEWAKVNIPGGLSLSALSQGVMGGIFGEKGTGAVFKDAIRGYYRAWGTLPASQKYLGRATPALFPSGPAAPQQAFTGGQYQEIPAWEFALIDKFANEATKLWDEYLETSDYEKMAEDYREETGQKDFTAEDARQETEAQRQYYLASIKNILVTGGVSDPRLKALDPDLFNLIDDSLGITSYLKTSLAAYGTDISSLGGEFKDDDVYFYQDPTTGTYRFYNSKTGAALPAEFQDFYSRKIADVIELAEQSKQAQIAALGTEGKQKKAIQEYFDLNKLWQSSQMEAHKSVLFRNEPQGRASYDIIVAKDAEEARRLGYASYIPEDKWNSPRVQAIVESEKMKNLSIMTQRLGLFREEKVGTTTVRGRVPGGERIAAGTAPQTGFPVWQTLGSEWLPSPAPTRELYRSPESQVDIGVAMGTAPSIWDKIAKLTDAERNMATQMARKAGMEAAGGTQPAGIVVRDERSPLWHTEPDGSRKQGAWIMSPKEWLASSQRKHRADLAEAMSTAAIKRERELEESYKKYVTPEGVTSEWGEVKRPQDRTQIPTGKYVLPGEKTPAWMSKYVPGLKAGEALRLGHYFPAFSAQQWLAIPESHKAYLQSYVEASRQVLGPKIPLKPWEDMTQQMRTGLPYSQVPSTRFRRAIQRV